MIGSRGRRLLSDAEIEIWLKVAQTVSRREGAVLPGRRAKPAPTPVDAGVVEPPTGKRLAAMPSYTPPGPPPKPRHPPLAPLEKRFRRNVEHGRIDIDGALDLHGMTQPEAHAALAGFLRAAQARGARLVLVVTGKGRARAAAGYDAEPGVLRRAVPLWLRATALRPVVLGFEEAGLPHGGLGALYVRLRRRDPG